MAERIENVYSVNGVGNNPISARKEAERQMPYNPKRNPHLYNSFEISEPRKINDDNYVVSIRYSLNPELGFPLFLPEN
jgi:hypothetical protein